MSYSAPSSAYQPLLLSHQTGLSVTVSTANTYYNIGSSFTVPRNGILKIRLIGYVNGNGGYYSFNITTNSNTYQLNATNPTYSDFGGNSGSSGQYAKNTSPEFLAHNVMNISYGYFLNYTLELPVLANDIIQPIASNYGSGNITYITDLVVILQ